MLSTACSGSSDNQERNFCLLCKQPNTELRRNHLFPEFANRTAREKLGQGLQLLFINSGELVRRPAGIYQVGLFCNGCEEVFSQWEKETAEFTRTFPQTSCLTEFPGGFQAWEIDSALYRSLKLFALSLVLRFDYSDRPEAGSVNLGDHHRDRIANLLIQRDPGRQEDYPVVLIRYRESIITPGSEVGMSVSARTRRYGRWMYQFDLAGFGFKIFVDSQQPTDEMMFFALRPDSPSLVLSGRYDGSARDLATEKALQRNSKFIHPTQPSRKPASK